MPCSYSGLGANGKEPCDPNAVEGENKGNGGKKNTNKNKNKSGNTIIEIRVHTPGNVKTKVNNANGDPTNPPPSNKNNKNTKNANNPVNPTNGVHNNDNPTNPPPSNHKSPNHTNGDPTPQEGGKKTRRRRATHKRHMTRRSRKTQRRY